MSFDHRPLRVRPGRTSQAILSRLVSGCLAAVLMAVAGATGCQGGSSDDPLQTSEMPGDLEPAGVFVIQAADAAWPNPPLWRLADPMRVGALEGELAFGRIADVAPRAGGGMWILDSQSRTAYGVDESGAFVVPIGGPGDGPGELGNPTGVFELDDGRIVVTESYPPALHRFDSLGSYLETAYASNPRSGQASGSPPPLGQWRVMPDGESFVHLWSIPMPGGGPHVIHSLVRTSAEAGGSPVADTLLQWNVEATSAEAMAEVKLIQVHPQWAIGLGSTLWWTPGDPYELRAYSSDGDLERIVRVPGDGVRLDDALRSKIEAYLLRLEGPGPGGNSVMAGLVERASWPESLPQVAKLWVSLPRGRVFAARYEEGLYDDPPSMRVDIFEPDGSYAGRLDLPGGFSPRRFAEGAVFGVASDELDVSYAVRYRLQSPE